MTIPFLSPCMCDASVISDWVYVIGSVAGFNQLSAPPAFPTSAPAVSSSASPISSSATAPKSAPPRIMISSIYQYIAVLESIPVLFFLPASIPIHPIPFRTLVELVQASG
ncbi:hypothetical protein LTS18_005397, partial [Coniosporium uncinatum]